MSEVKFRSYISNKKIYETRLARNEEERCRWPWEECPCRIKEGNRFLCAIHFEEGVHAIPEINYFALGAQSADLKKIAKEFIEKLEKSIISKATIITTSLETAERYPNAVLVTQEEARRYLGEEENE